MSEEHSEEFDEAVPPEEEGTFYVSQISPIEPEEELKPEVKGTAEGDEETVEDVEDEGCTYQTAPTVPIKPNEILRIAQRILEERLKGKTYSPSSMKKAASQISVLIREDIKKLNLDRYRIICQVTVGEKCDQDVFMNFLSLWKHEVDHYAVATYEETTFFATALVFLVYKI